MRGCILRIGEGAISEGMRLAGIRTQIGKRIESYAAAVADSEHFKNIMISDLVPNSEDMIYFFLPYP